MLFTLNRSKSFINIVKRNKKKNIFEDNSTSSIKYKDIKVNLNKMVSIRKLFVQNYKDRITLSKDK